MEKIEKWLNDNPISSGYGDGYGDGFGDGSGSGDGFGFDSGCGDGSGDSSGYGDGSGYGSGYGYRDGSGHGYGCGDGDGFTNFNGMNVYKIDHVLTIITQVKGTVAKGFILNSDFTLNPCFVMKGRGYFAHGKTLKDARDALQKKILKNIDSDEVIEKFLEKFKKNEKYPGAEFFEWHHYLTGSCLMGRESFVKNKGLDLSAEYTVDEFIAVCEDSYGSDIIKKLKERWVKDESK